MMRHCWRTGHRGAGGRSRRSLHSLVLVIWTMLKGRRKLQLMNPLMRMTVKVLRTSLWLGRRRPLVRRGPFLCGCLLFAALPACWLWLAPFWQDGGTFVDV